ncbi:uncharacterized protein LOC134285450 [Aedes albopictus]|uniref:Uncharacterized protein n=1 Tax=Aedes albopictus TaxID=7160 RepID=A0ABM1Y7C3_AEDAL
MSANSKDKSPEAGREVGCVHCSRPDSFDNFVQCDQCDGWWHMRCAGVTNSVSERPWTCSTCLPLSVSSSSSNAARIALRLKRIEEERAIQRREWEAEKRAFELEKKAFEHEKKVVQEKYRLLEEQLAERVDGSRRSQVSRRSSMRRVSSWVENLSTNPELEGAVGGAVPRKLEAEGAVDRTAQGKKLAEARRSESYGVSAGNEVSPECHKPPNEGQQQQESNANPAPQSARLDAQDGRLQLNGNQQRNTGAFPKTIPNSLNPNFNGRTNPTDGNVFASAPFVMPPGKLPTSNKTHANISAQTSDDPYGSLLARLGSFSVSPNNVSPQPPFVTESVIRDHVTPIVSLPPPITERNENMLGQTVNTDYVNNSQSSAPFPRTTVNVPDHVPSPSQLAARQVMPRDLPPFSGDPADWPIFISAFENTTVACGYSRVENLARLQRCLKGAAYESVRSRLLLPESVPQVISTLRLLYGRPELLISVLLDKVRSTPAPRAEKLETLIEFGMAVQSLCDHLVAAGQQSHLTSPYLLMELVEKLPAHVKMEWASYMQRFPDVNLKTFGDFMSTMVISASKVTLYTGASCTSTTDRSKPKPRGSVNTHISEPEIHIPSQCCVCKELGHFVRECDTFNALSVDERWKAVQTHELCRNCLNAHGTRNCRNARQCGINGCTYRHHRLLHSNRSNRTTNPARNMDSAGNHTHRLDNQSLLFRILPVTLHGPSKKIKTYAFLDDGSHLTLIEDQLAKDLGVEGRTIPLCLTWTGDVSRLEPNSKQIQLGVSGADGRSQQKLSDVRTVKKLALPGQTLRMEDLGSTFNHLKGLPISGYEDAVPRLLIGVNNLHLTVPLKVKEGRVSEPVAVKTRLGWCVYGGSSNRLSTSLNIHACQCSNDGDLHELVKSYFTLDDVGMSSTKVFMSAEDKRAQQILQETTVRIGERYETGLLWKHDEVEFPDSYGMAMRRLECLERRMSKNLSLKESLSRQIEEYQQKGYAHRVSGEEMKQTDLKRVWYLPLGAVVNPKKPEKVRLIWDAAAVVDGISLNAMLLKGPDQLASLVGVLFRFRQYNVAVSADIREMFHQIRIRATDRHSQRFLWRDDPSMPAEIFVMDVATFGSTCSPASAQYVKNLNAAEYAEKHPKAVGDIVNNTYVDDYLASFESKTEATDVAVQVRDIQQEGGFSLRNWQSNSVEVTQALGEPSATSGMHSFQDKSQAYERILGMLWLTDEDVLSFSTQLKDDVQQIVYGDSNPTKRQVLRCLMSFFDPLGLLGFLLVHGKILLQDIWRAGTQWDQEVEEEHRNRWRDWISLLQQISTIKLPRCYFLGATRLHYQRLQLHIFVDASETAYAAVAYFRIVDLDGMVRCALVSAKTKVAPLKPLSIPRLELQAAVLGTRLMRFVEESHTLVITQRYFWSDSSTVLAWLKADPRKYKQYVACRIGEILSVTEVNEWKWVPTKLNPADLATKWGSGPSLDAKSVWFTGPYFLQKPFEEWPKQNTLQRTVDVELRTCNVHTEATVRLPVINYARFSKWERLHRATAYVHRYVGNLKRKSLGVVRSSGYLTQAELQLAEITLITGSQWQEYPSEMVVLQRNRSRPETERECLSRQSALYQLTPFVDEEGVLRIDGRIGAAKDVCINTKFPAILPRKHRICELIVDLFHRKYQHANSETVVNEIRQQYYIPRLRSLVRKVVNGCPVCKARKAVPHVPRMASLPPARLASFARPFTYVGLDYFGPLVVKVGRGNAKRWIALFTCLTIRAVHCEVVCSLSTDACIKAIRRFVCRRGAPAEIYSDNGTNFQGVERILMKEIQLGVAATITSTTTKWFFIPPASPHMGGAWERMVRSIKQAMMGAYRCDRKLDDESLLTFVIEAENIVNSRPLTYLPLDSAESEALTPNHFLLGSSSGVRQPGVDPNADTVALRNSLNLIKLQLDRFWTRWIKEMLPTLTRRTKWFGEEKMIAVGDLVLIVDDGNRNNWTRGRVQEVIPGSDGRVRQALVKTARGCLRRPVAKLAILDILDGSKTGTGGQHYGGEDVAAGSPASNELSANPSQLNREADLPIANMTERERGTMTNPILTRSMVNSGKSCNQ